MRILILLMLLVSAKITNAAPTEQTPNFILEPIQQTQQKKVVLYNFSPDLMRAAADCRAYSEDFVAQNPDLQHLSNQFGGAKFKIDIDIKGISDDLCRFSVTTYLEGVGGTKTTCGLNGSEHLSLIKAMKDRSFQPITLTYTTINDKENEPPVQTTLTAGHFDAVWTKLRNEVCHTSAIAATPQEIEQNRRKIDRLPSSLQSALQTCRPTVEKRHFMFIENNVTIIGPTGGKCHLLYNNFDIYLPQPEVANLKSYDDLNALLLNKSIAVYRDKDNIPTQNLLFATDFCRKHKFGQRRWSEPTSSDINLKIERGLAAKYTDNSCRIKLINSVRLPDKKLDYSLFCDIDKDILDMVLMSYENLLADFGEKKLTDDNGNISYLAPQGNDKTEAADAKFLQELQRLHLCLPATEN